MAAEPEKKSDGKGGWKSFVAGGFGGICVVLSGHPFDTIKVRKICFFFIKNNKRKRCDNKMYRKNVFA